MNSIRQTQELNKRELEAVVPPSASWHADYRHTAFIYIGGLPLTLSEGDVITIFSQYGNPVYLNLVRDKETGKSRGFCFLKYEDQRSCDLAVDNLGGAKVLDRLLRVDHTEYKIKEGEMLRDNTGADEEDGAQNDGDSGREDREDVRRLQRPVLKEEQELAKLEQEHDDEDPMKEYLVQEKREEVVDAVARWEAENKDGATATREKREHRSHRHHRSRRDEDARDRDRKHRHRKDRSRSPDSDRDRKHRHRREHTHSPSSDDSRSQRRRHKAG